MRKPRLLLLTNEAIPGRAAGQINGYEILVQSDEIESCIAISLKEGFDRVSAFERVLNATSRKDYDVVVIWTPGFFPASEVQFFKILQAINGRPVMYWEGDPWGPVGRKKPVTKQMSWWMAASEIVFSVATNPHFKIYSEMGAKVICHIPHTYCHLFFKSEESHPPISTETSSDLVMIGSNTARIPGVTGSPGSLRRWELATRIHSSKVATTNIYGKGWPKGWSKGFLPYNEQARQIRKHKLSVNWDCFDEYDDYASDRLPISLLAGRVHVTTRHPGMNWAPSSEFGLFQESTHKMIMERATELLNFDPNEIAALGLEAHRWTKFRMSHREAARYIMSSFYEHIKKPPSDPWGNLKIWEKG